MHVGGIFCEVAKAFDCKNHEILLDKLHFCGIRSMSEDCFKFHLTNKRQKVIQPKMFLCLGYNETWIFSWINCRASIVYNILKCPSTENKLYITTSIICW